jgi:pimeloyl-ACP methyl ester carboxylesterase
MTAEPTAPEWLTEPLSKPARQSATLVDGCPIAIYEWGSLGDRPIVLLHGGAGHARWWSHIGPYLADDHHVITFDWSGHGDSGWREPDDYTREQWCRELFGVIESAQLRERPLVFGHSMGGLNLITAAHERGDDLAGMVILDAAVRTPEQVRDMRPGAVFRNPATYASKEIAQKRYRLVPPQPNGDPALMEYISATSLREVADGWTWKFDPGAFKVPKSTPIHQQVGELNCPSMLVRCEKSWVLDEASYALMRTMCDPQMRHVQMPHAHHHMMIDNPVGTVDVMRTIAALWDWPA